MTLKAFEFRRMRLFQFVLFTAPVTVHTPCNVAGVSVGIVIRQGGILFARKEKQKPNDKQDKDNKDKTAFHK